jgi:hypothetical protein
LLWTAPGFEKREIQLEPGFRLFVVFVILVVMVLILSRHDSLRGFRKAKP